MSSNMLERLNKGIRRRTRVIDIFINPELRLRLITVVLMEHSQDWSVTRSHLMPKSRKGPSFMALITESEAAIPFRMNRELSGGN